MSDAFEAFKEQIANDVDALGFHVSGFSPIDELPRYVWSERNQEYAYMHLIPEITATFLFPEIQQRLDFLAQQNKRFDAFAHGQSLAVNVVFGIIKTHTNAGIWVRLSRHYLENGVHKRL